MRSGARRAVEHSLGFTAVPGIPATRPPQRETLFVFGVDPGATTGWALLEVSRAHAKWIAAGSERDVCDVIRWLRARPEPDLVAIERIGKVFSRARFGAGMAKDLAHASWIGGEVAGAARQLGRAPVDVEAAVWRRALVGSAAPKNARIARALGMLMKLPARSNAHERDAAGVALYCARRALIQARIRFAEAT